jgi:hypothetical protein
MSQLLVLAEDSPPNPSQIFVDGAQNICVTSEITLRPKDRIVFEVLEDDGRRLECLQGRTATYRIDSGPAFSAELTSLQLCDPTDGALLLLAKPALRGVLTIQSVIDAADMSQPR